MGRSYAGLIHKDTDSDYGVIPFRFDYAVN